jgi:hypothetical protein
VLRILIRDPRLFDPGIQDTGWKKIRIQDPG